MATKEVGVKQEKKGRGPVRLAIERGELRRRRDEEPGAHIKVEQPWSSGVRRQR